MKIKRSNCGFNIIEIVVALALLSFGLYGAADLVASARKTSSLTHNRMQATSLAQLKLQELRCARENLIPLFTNSQQVDLPVTGAEVFEQNPKFSWKAQLVRRDTTPPLIDVTVMVGPVGDVSTTNSLVQVNGTVFATPPAARQL